MPAYVIDISCCRRSALHGAIDVLDSRFPEIDLGSVTPHLLGWRFRCDAPSIAHLHRWLSETGLTVDAIEPAR